MNKRLQAQEEEGLKNVSTNSARKTEEPERCGRKVVTRKGKRRSELKKEGSRQRSKRKKGKQREGRIKIIDREKKGHRGEGKGKKRRRKDSQSLLCLKIRTQLQSLLMREKA